MNYFSWLFPTLNIICLPLILDSVMRSILLFRLLSQRVLGRRSLSSPRTIPKIPGRGAIVLIAARDEAGTIGATVASILPLLGEWPESQLHVVADHCVDGTAAEAEAAGASVAERRTGPSGKGAVIEWWLAGNVDLWSRMEVVVIVDADSRLAPGSLAALGEAIAGGADAAQAFVAPLAESRTARLAGWSEVLMQQIDDQARQQSGWAVPLRGTGMALRCPILAELAPLLHTQAEDLELDLLLAVRDARVDFVPNAILYDPKPLQAAGASRQRARWFRGQLDVIYDYHAQLGQILARGRQRSLTGDLFLLVLLFLRPKLLMIGIRLLLLPFVPVVALFGLLLDLVYYAAGVAFVDRPAQYLRDLSAVPLYAAVWLYGLFLAIINRGRQVWLKAGR